MNQVVYLNWDGVGFIADNPDEPTSRGYGFIWDDLKNQVILWYECNEMSGIEDAQSFRKQLIQNRKWGKND